MMFKGEDESTTTESAFEWLATEESFMKTT